MYKEDSGLRSRAPIKVTLQSRIWYCRKCKVHQLDISEMRCKYENTAPSFSDSSKRLYIVLQINKFNNILDILLLPGFQVCLCPS